MTPIRKMPTGMLMVLIILTFQRKCSITAAPNKTLVQTGVSDTRQDNTTTCNIESQSQDIKVCDRIKDGVNIAASLLQSLPSVQGPKGDRGIVGPMGIRGPPGKLGPRGLRGGRGEAGPTGMEGPRGPAGYIGLRGMKGERGEPGAGGMEGPSGPVGNMGPGGMRGFRGSPGPRGLKGQKGERNSQMCAYAVHRSSAMYGTPRPRIITFTDSTINHGSDMNYGTGIFTCQIPGLYFFMYSMRTAPRTALTVRLVKNDVAENQVHTDWGWRIMILSQSIILDLVAGDRVWLELHGDDSVLGSSNYKANTFTGQLILPTF